MAYISALVAQVGTSVAQVEALAAHVASLVPQVLALLVSGWSSGSWSSESKCWSGAPGGSCCSAGVVLLGAGLTVLVADLVFLAAGWSS